MRKIKLLDEDLDTSEDKAQEALRKFQDTEAQLEESQRENKQLQHRIDTLEGEEGRGRTDALVSEEEGGGEGLMHWLVRGEGEEEGKD